MIVCLSTPRSTFLLPTSFLFFYANILYIGAHILRARLVDSWYEITVSLSRKASILTELLVPPVF